MKKATIGVYMGAHQGELPVYNAAAQAVGQAIGDHDWALVYGGSKGGLMGTVAKSALAAGAPVTGIHPTTLPDEASAEDIPMNFISVPDMDTRKRMMFEQSDAFVFLPGGLGTLEELAQVLSWTKLGYYDKPIVLIDIEGYWDSLVAWLQTAVSTNFTTAASVDRIQVLPSVAATFDYLATQLD